MIIRNLDFNPSLNPGVLNTATWDKCNAWLAVANIDSWSKVYKSTIADNNLCDIDDVTLFPASLVRRGFTVYFLAKLKDNQQVFIEIGNSNSTGVFCDRIDTMFLGEKLRLSVFPATDENADRYFLKLRPNEGMLALGQVPRIGVGTRMTTSVFPAVLDSMAKHGYAANIVQNSVRELNFLDDILNAKPAAKNYACGFGTIETGYTGSTFEGLWLSGTLSLIQTPGKYNCGSDADHLQVKRGESGIELAKKYIDACRCYSFYTLDMADILNYNALLAGDCEACDYISMIEDPFERKQVIAYHSEPITLGGVRYSFDENDIARFVGKYWNSLDALGVLANYINSLKDGRAYDLEFTIDEHPPEVAAFDCLTSSKETLFVLRELMRRGLPVTHIATNLGQEKGFDYRCPDGLDGLKKRLQEQFDIAEEFGILLDIHSADDLTSPVRKVIKKVCGGKIHYKVSPMLQLHFADVLKDYDRELFNKWYDDAEDYAKRESNEGSDFAMQCLKADEGKQRAVTNEVFRHYSFAYVGKRDDEGKFIHRDLFYDLPDDFYKAHNERISNFLSEIVKDLF